jgi:hypothetical protein
MSRIVVVILIYHCHRPKDPSKSSSCLKGSWVHNNQNRVATFFDWKMQIIATSFSFKLDQ